MPLLKPPKVVAADAVLVPKLVPNKEGADVVLPKSPPKEVVPVVAVPNKLGVPVAPCWPNREGVVVEVPNKLGVFVVPVPVIKILKNYI